MFAGTLDTAAQPTSAVRARACVTAWMTSRCCGRKAVLPNTRQLANCRVLMLRSSSVAGSKGSNAAGRAGCRAGAGSEGGASAAWPHTSLSPIADLLGMWRAHPRKDRRCEKSAELCACEASASAEHQACGGGCFAGVMAACQGQRRCTAIIRVLCACLRATDPARTARTQCQPGFALEVRMQARVPQARRRRIPGRCSRAALQPCALGGAARACIALAAGAAAALDDVRVSAQSAGHSAAAAAAGLRSFVHLQFCVV